ncbi:unnamed protein product [Discosporangium mesarthrocarpum]
MDNIRFLQTEFDLNLMMPKGQEEERPPVLDEDIQATAAETLHKLVLSLSPVEEGVEVMGQEEDFHMAILLRTTQGTQCQSCSPPTKTPLQQDIHLFSFNLISRPPLPNKTPPRGQDINETDQSGEDSMNTAVPSPVTAPCHNMLGLTGNSIKCTEVNPRSSPLHQSRATTPISMGLGEGISPIHPPRETAENWWGEGGIEPVSPPAPRQLYLGCRAKSMIVRPTTQSDLQHQEDKGEGRGGNSRQWRSMRYLNRPGGKRGKGDNGAGLSLGIITELLKEGTGEVNLFPWLHEARGREDICRGAETAGPEPEPEPEVEAGVGAGAGEGVVMGMQTNMAPGGDPVVDTRARWGSSLATHDSLSGWAWGGPWGGMEGREKEQGGLPEHVPSDLAAAKLRDSWWGNHDSRKSKERSKSMDRSGGDSLGLPGVCFSSDSGLQESLGQETAALGAPHSRFGRLMHRRSATFDATSLRALEGDLASKVQGGDKARPVRRQLSLPIKSTALPSTFPPSPPFLKISLGHRWGGTGREGIDMVGRVARRGLEAADNAAHVMGINRIPVLRQYLWGQVHTGFWYSYAAVREELHTALRKVLMEWMLGRDKPPDIKLFFTGHSLGGALAMHCAMDLKVHTLDRINAHISQMRKVRRSLLQRMRPKSKPQQLQPPPPSTNPSPWSLRPAGSPSSSHPSPQPPPPDSLQPPLETAPQQKGLGHGHWHIPWIGQGPNRGEVSCQGTPRGRCKEMQARVLDPPSPGTHHSFSPSQVEQGQGEGQEENSSVGSFVQEARRGWAWLGEGGPRGDALVAGDAPGVSTEGVLRRVATRLNSVATSLDPRKVLASPGIRGLRRHATGGGWGPGDGGETEEEKEEEEEEEEVVLPVEPELYIYGAPRVGNHIYASRVDELVPATFRVTVDGDPVPGLPSWWYRHAGTKVLIDGKGRGHLIIDPSFVEKRLVTKSKSRIQAHCLEGYRAGLRGSLLQALPPEIAPQMPPHWPFGVPSKDAIASEEGDREPTREALDVVRKIEYNSRGLRKDLVAVEGMPPTELMPSDHLLPPDKGEGTQPAQQAPVLGPVRGVSFGHSRGIGEGVGWDKPEEGGGEAKVREITSKIAEEEMKEVGLGNGGDWNSRCGHSNRPEVHVV